MRHSVNSLRQMANLAKEYSQVSNRVQRYAELIQKCNDDLRHLIRLRHDHAVVLEKKLGTLDHIDDIISNAHTSLDNLTRLLEACRPPERHGEETSFRNKVKWILVHLPDFQDQQPALRRVHDHVLQELDLLRQTIIMSSFDEQSAVKKKPQIELEENRAQHTDITMPPVFENLALLNDLMGDLPGMSERESPALAQLSHHLTDS